MVGGDVLYSIIFGFFLFLLAEGPGNGILTLLRQYIIKYVNKLQVAPS